MRCQSEGTSASVRVPAAPSSDERGLRVTFDSRRKCGRHSARITRLDKTGMKQVVSFFIYLVIFVVVGAVVVTHSASSISVSEVGVNACAAV